MLKNISVIRKMRLINQVKINFSTINQKIYPSTQVMINGKQVYFDQINSTHYKFISNMSSNDDEFKICSSAAQISYEKNEIPPLFSDSYSSLMKIFEKVGKTNYRDELLDYAMADNSRVSLSTMKGLISAACSIGLPKYRKVVEKLEESKVALDTESSEEIMEFLSKNGEDEDKLKAYELFKQHLIICNPGLLIIVLPVLEKKKNLRELLYLKKIYEKGYPKIHHQLAKLFRRLEQYEYALSEYHLAYDYNLFDPKPMEAFDYAVITEDKSLMTKVGNFMIKNGCSKQDGEKILKAWIITLKNPKMGEKLQNDYPDLLGDIKIELPKPKK